MIVVRFTGGLGNQMFQYALGLHLSIKNKTDLKIDTTLLLDRSEPHEIVTHRNLAIDILNVKLNIASQKDIWHFNGKSHKNIFCKIANKISWQFRKNNLIIEKERNFQPSILALSDNKCLVGAWQSEKYFKSIEQEIRKQYTFKETLTGIAGELANQIQAKNSIAIQVRRGDYVTSPVYSKTLGAMPVDYFKKGFELLQSKTNINHIYFFSDDINWCKENLKLPITSTYVEAEFPGLKFGTYLHLMSLCNHFIIPNSSFGWWGAWLGKKEEKIVIAPGQWYKDSSLKSEDIVPESWIKLNM